VTPVSREGVTIGIDVGSTAVKAVVADADGCVTARVRIPHGLRVPAPNRLEHDAEEAWRRGPLAALDQLRQLGYGPEVRAVAVSAMVPSLTAVDAAGTPLTPGLLYGDERGRVPGGQGERAQPLPALGEAAEFLRWTAAEAPDAAGYWPAPSVANHALAGEALIDVATAATAFPLFDGTGWNPTACAHRGATVEQMPRVETIGTVAGQVRGTGALLGIGAIDALCEQIVAGADRDGDVLVMCGTTLIVWTTLPEARQVPGLWAIPHTTAGKSQIGGASNAGGLFLGWVDRLVGPGDPASVEPHRVPVWSPYIRGERTPFHDPDRRAVLDALDLSHDAASLRRAAYEASGFVVRQLIELSGASALRIVATGGGTRLQPWMQAIADATGRPVEVSAVAEGAALGAAFLARMAAGLETTIADAAHWASTDRVVDPDPGWAAAIEDRYQRFLELGNRRSDAIPPAAAF
jgi:sugar (pentulose or hexulose) kinase